MAFLSVLISAVAALLFYITEDVGLMSLAIITTFGNFWTWRIMHNKIKTATKWITWINLLFTLIAIVLLFKGILLIYK